MKTIIRNNWILAAILLVYLFLALYQLDNIPAAIWGDAIEHYYLAENILHGHPFFNYAYGGDGPVFSYIVVLVSVFFGLSFYSLKLTAVFIGFFFVLSLYFLAKEFFHNKHIALLSTAISAISFWTIDFARQPHARILVPLFICLTLLFTLKKKNTLAGILLGLGMYTQASIWGLILTYWRNIRILLIGLILMIPLGYSFSTSNFLSNQSYFGEKLAVHTPILQVITAIAHNIVANALSFNVHGDETFRMNIPGHPHLDFLSGILFDIGFLLLLYQSLPKILVRKIQKFFGFIRAPFEKNKIMRAETEKNFSYRADKQTFLLYFILPFFFIQVPSLLDVHNYFVQPNISRMIGIIPFVYMSIAYCIFLFAKYCTSFVHKATLKKILFAGVYGVLLIGILILNFYNYFIVYPRTLPNGNTPFDKIIAQAIDKTSPTTKIIIIGAGWGQYAQPEVAGIPIVQKTMHPEFFVDTPDQTQQILCQSKTKGQQIFVVSNPDYQQTLQTINLCMQKGKSSLLSANGWNVAYTISGKQ